MRLKLMPFIILNSCPGDNVVNLGITDYATWILWIIHVSSLFNDLVKLCISATRAKNNKY